MKCSKHEYRDASGSCVHCGKLFCDECLVEIEGRFYCKDDVAYAFSNQDPTYPEDDFISERSRGIALILCFFFGAIGLHRFYVGKIGSGIGMIFTFGGFGIWILIDLIKIATGSFYDANGRVLQYWDINI